MRILKKIGSTITDLTQDLKTYENGSVTISSLDSSDALYFGQRFPFNHLYFEITTPSTESVTMSAKIYTGTEFVAVAELVDETISSGATLGQSGFISIVPDKDLSGWSRDDTDDMTELSTVKIYDQFWLQLTFSASVTANIVLKWVGNLFSTDEDLYTEYPIFNDSNMRTAFGVSDWKRTTARAGELIIQDLTSKGIIDSGAQILDRDKLREASVSKTAELIFGGLGDDYRNDKNDARINYEERVGKGIYHTDINQNGILDYGETKRRTGYLGR